VFRALVLARIIEPTSKLDSLRVLTEAGMDPPSYQTVKRRLRIYAGAGRSYTGWKLPHGPASSPPGAVRSPTLPQVAHRTATLRNRTREDLCHGFPRQ
jgi:hypothetical protein